MFDSELAPGVTAHTQEIATKAIIPVSAVPPSAAAIPFSPDFLALLLLLAKMDIGLGSGGKKGEKSDKPAGKRTPKAGDTNTSTSVRSLPFILRNSVCSDYVLYLIAFVDYSYPLGVFGMYVFRPVTVTSGGTHCSLAIAAEATSDADTAATAAAPTVRVCGAVSRPETAVRHHRGGSRSSATAAVHCTEVAGGACCGHAGTGHVLCV